MRSNLTTPDAPALSSGRDVAAAELYPRLLPTQRHNEAHRAIRRGMERGGEVVAVADGFEWHDDSWFAAARVTVGTADGRTAVSVHVDRAREALACRAGTPIGGMVAGAFLAAQLGLTGAAGALALAGLAVGVPLGLFLDRWTRDRWRHRAWSTVEALGLLTTTQEE